MSEAVTVNTGRNTAYRGRCRGQTRYASYASGSVGSAALTFAYAPTIGDLDLDGIALSSPVDLNGGTITDLNGSPQTDLCCYRFPIPPAWKLTTRLCRWILSTMPMGAIPSTVQPITTSPLSLAHRVEPSPAPVLEPILIRRAFCKLPRQEHPLRSRPITHAQRQLIEESRINWKQDKFGFRIFKLDHTWTHSILEPSESLQMEQITTIQLRIRQTLTRTLMLLLEQ